MLSPAHPLALRALDRWAAAHTTLRQVAHAIASPLNVILGFSSMLADDEALPEEARGHASKVAEQARKIRRILDDAIEATSRPAPSATTASLPELLDEARSLATVEVSVEGDRDTPPIRADAAVVLAALTAWLPHARTGTAVTVQVKDVDAPADRHAQAGRFVVVAAHLEEGDVLAPAILEATLRGLMRAAGGFAAYDDEALSVELAFPTA